MNKVVRINMGAPTVLRTYPAAEPLKGLPGWYSISLVKTGRPKLPSKIVPLPHVTVDRPSTWCHVQASTNLRVSGSFAKGEAPL